MDFPPGSRITLMFMSHFFGGIRQGRYLDGFGRIQCPVCALVIVLFLFGPPEAPARLITVVVTVWSLNLFNICGKLPMMEICFIKVWSCFRILSFHFNKFRFKLVKLQIQAFRIMLFIARFIQLIKVHY